MPVQETEEDLLVNRGENLKRDNPMSQMMKVFKEGKNDKLYQLCLLGSQDFHFTAFCSNQRVVRRERWEPSLIFDRLEKQWGFPNV